MQCWETFQINIPRSAHIFLKKVRGYFSFCLIFFLNRLLLLFCFHAQIDRITHRRTWLYGSNKSFTKKNSYFHPVNIGTILRFIAGIKPCTIENINLTMIEKLSSSDFVNCIDRKQGLRLHKGRLDRHTWKSVFNGRTTKRGRG